MIPLGTGALRQAGFSSSPGALRGIRYVSRGFRKKNNRARGPPAPRALCPAGFPKPKKKTKKTASRAASRSPAEKTDAAVGSASGHRSVEIGLAPAHRHTALFFVFCFSWRIADYAAVANCDGRMAAPRTKAGKQRMCSALFLRFAPLDPTRHQPQLTQRCASATCRCRQQLRLLLPWSPRGGPW